MRELKPGKKSPKVLEAERFFDKYLVGHKFAKRKMLRELNIYHAGLRRPNKAIGGVIFVGSSGVGKTELARLFAWALLGGIDMYKPGERPPANIFSCGEFQESFSISKLVGAPSGYVGHFDRNDPKNKGKKDPALFLQETLDEPHIKLKERNPVIRSLRERLDAVTAEYEALASHFNKEALEQKRKIRVEAREIISKIGPNLSVLVFDEFEKAHEDVGRILLQILEEGKLTLANNEITDFSNSYIILTSNLAQNEIRKIVSGRPDTVGFGALEKTMALSTRGAMVGSIARKAVMKTLPPELLSRFGGEEGIIDFQPLTPEKVRRVLKLQIKILNNRIMHTGVCLVLKKSAEDFLVEKGYSPLYGARVMEAAIKTFLLDPLADIKGYYEDLKGELIVMRKKRDNKLTFYEK